MSVRFSDRGFDAAEKRLKEAGLDCVRDGAAECQQVAQARARVGVTGDMRRSIRLIPTSDGAYVVGDSDYFVYHEYGTGEYAGDKDSAYPGLEPSSGSKRTAAQIPWVYFSDGRFYTTKGVRPAPMLRPGFNAGEEEFERSKKRKGL